MSNATEVFQQLDGKLRTSEGECHPLSDALELQLRLAHQVESLMESAEHGVSIPPNLEGNYQHSDRTRPHSSTGEILFVEQPNGEKLALKLLLKLDTELNFLPNPDQTYAFEHPAVRAMTAAGEWLMGRTANKNSRSPMYYGVANVERVHQGGVELLPFCLENILEGSAEPVIVMRQMEQSLADVLLDLREDYANNQPLRYDKQEVGVWSSQVFNRVLNASVPLPEDLAADIGSPAQIEELLTGKTIGWLTSRMSEPGIQQDPTLRLAVENATKVQKLFQKFFGMDETQAQLQLRAAPWVGEGEGARLAQTFSPGDTKFGNVMLGKDASGQPDVGLFDPQWLVLKPGAIGNERAMFAPWPFADFMQIAAYSAAQPAAYGFPELKQRIVDGVRQYYGKEHWSEWHELYLGMLVAYKLLVDVAYGIDPYLEKIAHGQPIPRQLKWILETHAREAIQVTKLAFHVYDEAEKKKHGKKASH